MLVSHYPPDFNNMLDSSLPNFSSFCHLLRCVLWWMQDNDLTLLKHTNIFSSTTGWIFDIVLTEIRSCSVKWSNIIHATREIWPIRRTKVNMLIDFRLININRWDSPTPVTRRRNEASTTLLFFFTSGWDTHLQKILFSSNCFSDAFVWLTGLCVHTHSSVQKAVWQSSGCWKTTGSCSKTNLRGRCRGNSNKSYFIPWSWG